MGQEPLTTRLLVSGLNSVVVERYSLLAVYVVVFYDWITSLDEEVALIYPAPWNVVKAAYIFCRHYPMAIAPFHLWGLLSNHEQHFCESYYLAFFACAIPTILSSQFILMLRTYAFSGRKRSILAILSLAFFGLVGVIIWVMSNELSLSPLFFIFKRGGCFAVSDQPTLSAIAASLEVGKAEVPIAYHIGLISVLSTFFDCLNMAILIWYCVLRGTLGPLGQSFLRQGMFVYVVMTALNALAISTYLSSYLEERGFGATSTFAYILPSSLSCRLVLMLRRGASPTQTELRLEHSHMIDEALEMITTTEESHYKDISRGLSSITTDAQAQP
jgi:hypothetical protein